MKSIRVWVIVVVLATWAILAVVGLQHPEDWRKLALGAGVAGLAGLLASLAGGGGRRGPAKAALTEAPTAAGTAMAAAARAAGTAAAVAGVATSHRRGLDGGGRIKRQFWLGRWCGGRWFAGATGC